MPLSPPPLALVWQMERFVPGLLPTFVALVNRVPFSSVNSWWRSPSDNERVGGAADSQHLWAAAVDVSGDLDAIETGARESGLIPVRFARHVHIQAWPAGVARQVGLPQALERVHLL